MKKKKKYEKMTLKKWLIVFLCFGAGLVLGSLFGCDLDIVTYQPTPVYYVEPCCTDVIWIY